MAATETTKVKTEAATTPQRSNVNGIPRPTTVAKTTAPTMRRSHTDTLRFNSISQLVHLDVWFPFCLIRLSDTGLELGVAVLSQSIRRLPEIQTCVFPGYWSYPAFPDRLTLSAIGLKRYLLSKFTGDIRSMPEWRLSGLYQASIH